MKYSVLISCIICVYFIWVHWNEVSLISYILNALSNFLHVAIIINVTIHSWLILFSSTIDTVALAISFGIFSNTFFSMWTDCAHKIPNVFFSSHNTIMHIPELGKVEMIASLNGMEDTLLASFRRNIDQIFRNGLRNISDEEKR